MSDFRGRVSGGALRLDKDLLLNIFREMSVRPGHKALAKSVAFEIESDVSGVIPDENRPPDDEQ